MAMHESCVFCTSPPVPRGGEHLWDNWLNRLDGRSIKDKYTVIQTGHDGELRRTYRSARIDATADVVCGPCNHGWMSDLTNLTKAAAEDIIRHERRVTMLN